VLTLGDGQWRVASAMALQELEIPTTLRGLMMARVDRLPENLQHVLRTAAVIGLQFTACLLDKVERRLRGAGNVLPVLERLTDLGVLVERPEAGEQVYAFRHILTQETVYHSLLRGQRPALHLTVAESIETLYAADPSQQAEVLALHYDRAQVRDKAMRYALLAGDRARQRFANREAVEYYSRALQLSQHLDGCEAERWHAAVGLGEVHQHIGEYEEAVACYQAALEEWGEAAPGARARVMLRVGQVWDKRGDLNQAERWLQQGLDQLDQASETIPELCAQIFSELGWLGLRRGDLASAQEWLERGLALVSDTDHYEVLSSILNRLGALHYHHSEWDRAVECVERALELRDQLGDLVGYARSLNNLGILKWVSGNWDGALADYERAVKMNERNGEVEGLAQACTNLGLLYTDRGEWEKAEENLQRSFVIARRIGHPYELAQAYMNLGRLYLFQGRWVDCARYLDAAIPLYTEAGARGHLNLVDAYYLQGRMYLEQGQVDVASQWLERSYELLRDVTGADEGESVEWGQYTRLMARIVQARGDLLAALGHLERSAIIFDAAGAQIEVGRTAYRMGLLWLELDHLEEARKEFTTARQVFERLGAAADLSSVKTQLARLGEP
jgi:tetratricopeptide (TPR) repeat protein